MSGAPVSLTVAAFSSAWPVASYCADCPAAAASCCAWAALTVLIVLTALIIGELIALPELIIGDWSARGASERLGLRFSSIQKGPLHVLRPLMSRSSSQ